MPASSSSTSTLQFKTDKLLVRHRLSDKTPPTAPSAAGGGGQDVYEQLRKLGELHKAGVLTDEEFEKKKADLLGRL
jgi:hypothetical protein